MGCDPIGEELGRGCREAALAAEPEDRACDRVEFWLPSCGDVFLHRALHLCGRCVVEAANRVNVDLRADCVCRRGCLAAAAEERRLLPGAAKWRGERGGGERDRCEED